MISKTKTITMELSIVWPENKSSIIKVIGVGGGGGNAVNYMYQQGIHNVDFVVCNTDAQDLRKSPVPLKVSLGELGAGGDPEKGCQAALDHLDKIREVFDIGTKMVFITAGMGGGTGTGAAPVVARIAKELGILTVAIVTIPFRNEGPKRLTQAIEGIKELKVHVDSLLVIDNEKLRDMYGDMKYREAYARADNVLTMAAKGIAELVTLPGYMNVDFADVCSIMVGGGITVMGSASAKGENRAREAIEAALNSPLLNNSDITGARRILLNITSGSGDYEITMDELMEITDYVTRSAKNASMIWGTAVDESLKEAVSVTVVATDFPNNGFIDPLLESPPIKKEVHLPGVEKPGTVTFIPKDKFADEPKPTQPQSIQGTYIVREKQTVTQNKIKWNPAETDTDVATETLENVRAIPFVVDENMNIDELENVPAIVRKKKALENQLSGMEKEVSKYTLSMDKKENTVRLRDNNSYLHDKAD